MIDFFLKNTQSIIIAILLITIIEMLLPNNSNKKYVKIVSGIYLIVTILNPFLKLFNKDFKLDVFENLESIETSSYITNSNLQKYYITSLRETIKLELYELGYNIKNIEIIFNGDYTQINHIVISGAKNEDELEIKKYISDNYSLDFEKIIFS